MNTAITCGISDDLIARIADYVQEQYVAKGQDLSRLAFVFGGKRPSLFLKKELARHIRGSFVSPRFFSMDEFMNEVVARREFVAPLSGIDACYSLYTITRDTAPDIMAGRETFSQFMPWASELAAFIDHVDSENIADAALENVQANAAIGYDVPDTINTLLRHIRRIREAFHGKMTEQKKYTRGRTYRSAAEHIADVPFDDFDQIVFCNLFYLTATERTVIKTLYDRGKATLFFQGDQKDWPVLDTLARNFSCRIQPPHHAEPNYELHLYAGFDTHSQVTIAREIVKKIDRWDKTVLVVPEPTAIIPVLSEIAPLVQALNVSLGYPLKRSSLYALFESIFKAQSTRRDGTYYTKDYLHAISHPLVKNLRLPFDLAVTRVLVHKIEEILLGIEESPLGGSLFVALKDLQDAQPLYRSTLETLQRMGKSVREEELKEIVAALHELLFVSWETIATFRQFAGVLEAMLDTLIQKSFLTSYPLNTKVVERLFDLSRELKNAEFGGEPFSQADIFKIVLDRVGGEMVSFTGSPLKGFQVLGIMESRSLNFENVIVMDANESILPRLKIYEPLIPREVMLSLGLNRIEKEEEIQRYQFMRLISPARHVHLIYSEDRQKEKSRFIEELVWDRQRANKSMNAIPVLRSRFAVNILTDKPVREKTADMAAYLKNIRYSSTKLNTYLDCPLRFYFQYVLGLQEKEDLREEVDGAEIGLLLHDVLNSAFKRFVGKKPAIDASFQESLFRKLDRAFDEIFKKKMKSDAFLIKEIVDHRMRQFLEKEQERPVRELLALEQSFAGTLAVGDLSVAFDARVDRIDRLENGSLLIVDYKTGGAERMPKGLKTLQGLELSRDSIKNAIDSFQLPLYIHLVRNRFPNERIDAALYNLRTTELSRYFKDDDDESNDARMKICMKSLEYVVNEITDPATPFVGNDKNREQCSSCPFFYACR